ncbi:MAG: two-component system chemotaxis response regulator CheY [Phenylobacterium sp.]|jgi:two-component system chemotaxis response regulator CheY
MSSQQLLATDLSILLIESSGIQRKIITRQLAKEGIEDIAEAKNITEAIHYLTSHIPDLVICSLHFPDGTGLELVTTIRNHKEWQDIPFMLVSSEHRKEQLEAFKQAGIVAILPKPFTAAHLGQAINTTIDLLSTDEMELSYFDIHQLRVLVVDDSRLARNHIKRVLSNLGILTMTEAENGQQAIELLSNGMYDLVVTDYNMPEVNGQELTEFIRQKSEQSHIPVLMVTSEASETHLSNIEQSGVNAMCDKPFEPEVVKQLLFKLLERGE